MSPFADPELFLNFLRETSAATWIVDGDGYVLDVPEWAALTGQSAEEAQGDGWMNAIHRDDVDRVRSAWETAVAHGTPYNTEYRLRCADGSYRWFNARGTPVPGPDGNTQRWVGVILAVAGTLRPAGESRPKPADRFTDITPGALRAARALLNWSAEKLADHAGVARSTVRRIESDEGPDNQRRGSLPKILKALAEQRICCLGSDGLITGVVDPAANSQTDQDAALVESSRRHTLQ